MSQAGDAAQDLINSYTEKISKVAPGAVGIQLGLMAAVGLASLCAFSVLRPNNSVVYQPKVKYATDEKRPPKIGKGLFDWVAPVLHVGEQDMMRLNGLDAVAYLRFLRMCRNLFICAALLTCAVLMPINVIYNIRNVASSNRNALLMLTMTQVKGNWLWAHTVMTYVITGMTFFFVWRNYAAIVKLRWQWFRSPAYQDMLYARSLMITQVSKKYQTDAGLHSLLLSLNIPYPTTAVHIGRRVGALPELVKKHNETVKELEEVLTRYFKDPNRLPSKRPTKRIGGWMGMGGNKVDAIDYLTEKIKRYEQRVEATRAQIHERKAESYGFASFESVPYAHIVAKTLRGKRKQGSYFDLAPQPKDIQWDNLNMGDAARMKNKFFGGILLVLLCGFYIIPLVAVALLANLAALSAYVGFINRWVNDYQWTFSAFVGVVPPLLTLLLQMILPMIIRWIASLQGTTTHTQADRIVTARYSAFLFITQFIIFSLLGVLVQIISQVVVDIQGHASVSKVLSYLATIPDKLQYTYMLQSNYWLTIMPLRGASACFDLAQLLSLSIIWIKTRLFGRTPREIREATKPPYFDFPVYYSNHLLIVAVVFAYAPLAPLVVAFGASVFAISYWVYKYQNLYVSVPRTETGGRLWNVVINRVLTALLLMHIFMAVSIGLQSRWFYAIALAPPAISVVVFKIILVRQFDDRFRWYIPSEAEMAEVHMHHADARKNRLQKRFGHDALSEPLYTPMLHKTVQHLLPTIYNGRIGHGEGKFEGKTVEQNTAGGLTFAMLEAHDLAIDRTQYLRERDEDEMTISTATALGLRKGPQSAVGTEADDYFSDARAEYLKQGMYPSQSSTPFVPGTPDELPLELQRMPTYDDATPGSFYNVGGRNTPNASTEHLINPTPQYPPTYSSPGRGYPGHARGASGSPRIGADGRQHVSNASQSSLASFSGASYYAQPADMAAYGVARPDSRQGVYGADFARRTTPQSDLWQPHPTGPGPSQPYASHAGRQPPSRQGTLDQPGPSAAPSHRGPAGASSDPYAGFAGPADYAPLNVAGESTDHLPRQAPPRR
ncbi:hypothetical protein JCM10908_002342 [Rhodotorula pacifica]|uniref:uncharacterized protein n=1 Tax=Rhodotorula pacifica TaxID=1495444 RepID=UPI003174ED9B